jgi:hypothetical protein
MVDQPQNAHCMFCRTEWTVDFLYQEFPSCFITQEYEYSRAKLKVGQEKQLLPQTVMDLHRRRLKGQLITIESDFQQQVRSFVRLCGDVRNHHYEPYNTHSLQYSKDINNTMDKMKDLVEQLKETSNDGGGDDGGEGSSSTTKEKKEHVMCHCPKEDCRGYISNRGKCGMCSLVVCTKCFQEKKEASEHICREEDVATAELIRKDCKQCPSCHVMIHRWEGCPQMFCTNCHTGFDWRTGSILKKLHNPHLTEYLRSQGRTEADQRGCQGQVNLRTVSDKAGFIYTKYISNIWNKVQHLDNHESNRLRGDYSTDYRELRENYVKKYITEEEWVNHVKQLRKKEQRNHEILLVIELLVDGVMAVLAHFQREGVSGKFEETKIQLDTLGDIVNKKLTDLEKRLKISCMKYKV